MKSDRMVIGAVLFLAAGLGLLFGFTNGTAGVNLGLPVLRNQTACGHHDDRHSGNRGAAAGGRRSIVAFYRADRGDRLAVPPARAGPFAGIADKTARAV